MGLKQAYQEALSEHVRIRGKGKGGSPVICLLMAIVWSQFIHSLPFAGEKRHSWASASISGST